MAKDGTLRLRKRENNRAKSTNKKVAGRIKSKKSLLARESARKGIKCHGYMYELRII